MDYEIKPTPDERDAARGTNGAGFALSPAPLVASDEAPDAGARPRTNAGPLLCLMARDPHTLFAYWEIDWANAFRDQQPVEHKVHLRITRADGSQQAIEVEPLAGSCYVKVDTADGVYSGDIGYYQPAAIWNSLAASDLITTPPEDLADFGEDNFATVPFHLSFQHMVDMLREARRDQGLPLVAQLAEVRERAAAEETRANLTPEQVQLANDVVELEQAASLSGAPQPDARELWRRERLERILGFTATSPSGGFTGGS